VPLCWPRFGSIDKTLPQHGFARTEMFEFVSSSEIDEEKTELIFRLKENSNTLKIWNYKFVLELKITLGQTLTMELTTTNVDSKSYMITQALHSYFPVSHISEAEVEGLDSKPYVDAVDGKTKLQRGAVVFNAEVNRVYQEVKDAVLLVDKNRTIRVKNSGSNSVVVWNPARENCHNMSAFNDDSYESFVCIESSNAFDDTITLEPNTSHTLKAVIDSI
jgi:glucose-6-phosphate 1-epimerase